MILSKCIEKLLEQKNLEEQEMMQCMYEITDSEYANDIQVACFLTALRVKGETVDEISAGAKVMRKKAEKINPKVKFCIDTCGTGGDGTNTFNISTAAAFIVSAAGVSVAKHGNRSVSSKSGSADVLEALGVNINLTPPEVEKCIEEVGIGFLFAPNFHKSMKNVAKVRKELGIRTIFNVLGPLTNPANASMQVVGVYDEKLINPIANVLLRLGVKRALVVRGKDGLDEISICDNTLVSEVIDGEVKDYVICPEEFGIKRSKVEDLKGGDAKENAKIISSILNGEDTGPKRDVVVINAAGALYLAGKVSSIAEGINIANEMIDSKEALEKLWDLIEFTKGCQMAI